MAKSSLKNLLTLVNEAKKQSPVAESFLQDYLQSIERTANSNKRKPSAHYKPSSLNCIRNMFYQIVEQEPDSSIKEAPLIGIGESGTDRHEHLQNAVIETWNISFLCDGIIKYRGELYIIEFKTEVSRKFVTRNDVDEDHKRQAIAYSLSLGLDKIIFVYENRDTCEKKCYLLEITEKMKKDLIQLIQDCDDYVDANIVPPKPVGIKAKICQYCIYRSQCRKD